MRLIPLFFLLLAVACSSPKPLPKVATFQGVRMTIPYRILVGAELNQGRREAIQTLIDLTFNEINQTFNKYNPDSELSKLNGLDAYVTEPISIELEELMAKTSEVVALSEGRFDPTVGSAEDLWQEYLSVGCKPPKEEVELCSQAVGWHRIHFEGETFWKENPKTRIDLGGIAKGLLVDLLTERIVTSGYPDVLVEWGGEIRAHGSHPEGRSWRVFISRLEDTNPEHAIDTLDLNDQAIATSGDYLQNWTVGGTSYTHIVDPLTCEPLKLQPHSIASVTVLAPTCTIADALATSAMLFPSVEQAKQWAEKVQKNHPEISFWFLTRESTN